MHSDVTTSNKRYAGYSRRAQIQLPQDGDNVV